MIDKIRNWKLQASGKSYWHQPLPMSEGFESSNLDFYFIDNSSKTNWQGATNKDGLPLLSVAGDMVLFPTTIFQKTLGHWNKFQGSPDDCSQNAIRDISQFWNGANWAIQNIDAEGGWKLPFGESVYSSMTQGQGISVLVRAHRLGGDERYMQSAIKALRLLEIDDVDGGVVSRVDGLPFLEEFPNSKHRAVLNGAIFALFGLHDLRLSTQTRSQDLIFDKHVKYLGQLLNRYDTGYWSRYDLSGNIASPFYHDLHISQLTALAKIDPTGPFLAKAKKFSAYKASSLNYYSAVCMKIAQKIFSDEPGHGTQKI